MSKEFEPSTRVCWVKQECKVSRNNEENRPGPRSGHTLNVIGMNGFLFGGIAMNKVKHLKYLQMLVNID